MHKRTARSAATALLVMVAGAIGGVSIAPTAAHAAFTSTLGGPITRAEVIERAQYWVDHQPGPYNQGAKSPDPINSRNYRRDCSGYVDMAWHINGDNNTATLPQIAGIIPRTDLLPGDILNDANDHVILFDQWQSDHVHFSYYSFGSTPVKHVTNASINQATFDSHPNGDYVARRYTNIQDVVSGGPNGVEAGDVNGDGKVDLVARKPDGTLWLYQHGSDDTQPYDQGTQIDYGWDMYVWFLPSDMNADHRADIVAERPDGTLWEYLNNGDNHHPYDDGQQIGSAWNQFDHITASDMNKDGLTDLIAARADGTLWQYLNDGNTDDPYESGGTQIDWGWQNFEFVLGTDLNSDGLGDIVATKYDGTLWYYANNGNPAAPYDTGVQIDYGWQDFNRVLTANFTADKRPDMVASAPDGALLLYTNNGNIDAPYDSGSQIGYGWQPFA